MKRPEQTLQRQVAAYLKVAYPGLVWFHPPNGGARSKVEGAIFKTMGVRAGVPDLVIVLPTSTTAFIELKAGKGALTEAQQAFRDDVRKIGCLWAECRSLADVAGTLDAWLKPLGVNPKAAVAA